MYRHLANREAAEPWERIFRYRWRHTATGTTGTRLIAILQGHIDSLLLYWSCVRWTYSPL